LSVSSVEVHRDDVIEIVVKRDQHEVFRKPLTAIVIVSREVETLGC